MFRIGEKVFDTSLNKEIVITQQLVTAFQSMDSAVIEKRWKTLEPVEDAVIVKEPKKEDKSEKESEMSLEDAHKAYEEKHGKEVANRYKNDLEWILSKI